MTTKIETLRSMLEEAKERETAAIVARAWAQAALAEAEGRGEDAAYSAAFAVAQERRTTEAHEAFMRIAEEGDARKVLAGLTTLDSYAAWQRPGIEAAIARLRETKPTESEVRP